MGKPTVKIIDAIYCEANKEARELIEPILRYKEAIWIRQFFRSASGKPYQRKVQKIVDKTLISGRKGSKGLFLTGLLPRVYKKIGDKITIENKEEKLSIKHLPKLPGIVFRNDQRRALRAVIKQNRGKIIFPTGSGKTVIAGGIVSMFLGYKINFLCHTSEIASQSRDEFIKWFGKENIFTIGGGYKDKIESVMKHPSPILIATVQSYNKSKLKELYSFWDLTIVDEVHHVNSKNSMYGSIMEKNLAPRRYGLTATEPSKKVQLLINEGYFGPTIAKLSVSEGIKLGIIARPQINLLAIPYNITLNAKCRTYEDFYTNCITQNKERNQLIRKSIKKNEITLILVERTEHGKLFQKLLNAPFVYGGTERNQRNKVKEQLKSGKIKLAICSRVWKEGINIPSLNHIINAVGMKEEKAVLQTAGRGLRTTKNKKVIKITDCLDPYKYLAEHSVQRIGVYVKQGWL